MTFIVNAWSTRNVALMPQPEKKNPPDCADGLFLIVLSRRPLNSFGPQRLAKSPRKLLRSIPNIGRGEQDRLKRLRRLGDPILIHGYPGLLVHDALHREEVFKLLLDI